MGISKGESLKVTRPNHHPRLEFQYGTQGSLQHTLAVQHLSGTDRSKTSMAPALEKLLGLQINITILVRVQDESKKWKTGWSLISWDLE